MKSCSHTSWLSFHDGEKPLLSRTSALGDVVACLDKPAEARPSFVLLIDNTKNGTLVDQVLPTSSRLADHHHCDGVSLLLDSDTAFSDRPVFIARSDPARCSKLSSEPEMALCHWHTVHELQCPKATSAELVHDFYCKVLYGFADVVCLFASELKGFRGVLDCLEAWLKRVQSQSRTPRPRMLVIAAPDEKRSPADVQQELIGNIHERCGPLNDDLLSCISVFVQHKSRQSLKDRIRWDTDISRNVRAQNCSLFSALHWEQLFTRACDHFIEFGYEPFDILAAARLHRPVSASLGEHLGNVLSHVQSTSEMSAFAAPYIAECLLLDNYTADVHAFDPREVFALFYKEVCGANVEDMTLRTSKEDSVPFVRTAVVRLIEHHFVTRARSPRPRCTDRSRALDEFRAWISEIKTYRSCLACLQRVPEYKFPCNHMICAECCDELGQHATNDPDLSYFASCPLCDLPCSIRIRVRPVTAGVRMLSIDGGGVRAVVPIQFLRALEQALDLNMPIQEHFDLSYGTSSGSMVNMALYGLGMSLKDVYNLFKKLSERIFRGRSGFGIGFAAAAHVLISSYYYGQFPSADIDGVLRELLGDTTMLDNSYMMSIGARIGFPIVNVHSLDTSIVTSYNGAGTADSKAYKVLRACSPSDEIYVRDAIRSASAAPWYFTPHTIPTHGTFYDGGLSDHNPGALMLQELQRIDPGCRRPDQFVSVGTGICTSDSAKGESIVKMRVNPLYQAYQHYMQNNFNGTQQFIKMRDMVKVSAPTDEGDVDEWMRRFDLPVEGPIADLADPTAIESLGTAAWEYFASHPSVHDLARSIVASTFYFQLRRMPVYDKGLFTCYGRILCRVPVSNPGFPSLMQKIGSLSATFSVQGRTLSTKGSSFDRLGNFCKPVVTHVSKLDDRVHARLEFSNTQKYYISASPMSVATLIRLQKLDWPCARTGTLGGRGLLKRRLPQDTKPRKYRATTCAQIRKKHNILQSDSARDTRCSAPSP